MRTITIQVDDAVHLAICARARSPAKWVKAIVLAELGDSAPTAKSVVDPDVQAFVDSQNAPFKLEDLMATLGVEGDTSRRTARSVQAVKVLRALGYDNPLRRWRPRSKTERMWWIPAMAAE